MKSKHIQVSRAVHRGLQPEMGAQQDRMQSWGSLQHTIQTIQRRRLQTCLLQVRITPNQNKTPKSLCGHKYHLRRYRSRDGKDTKKLEEKEPISIMFGSKPTPAPTPHSNPRPSPNPNLNPIRTPTPNPNHYLNSRWGRGAPDLLRKLWTPFNPWFGPWGANSDPN